MKNQSSITKAIEIAGLTGISEACKVTYQAVRKWEKLGRLPRTEWTGETDYCSAIEKATKGEVTREQLLNRSIAA